jgi:cellulose synthase/poly-beta-1,6-N-acetylglucosamine synthase-like glycosyltransferase
MTGRAADLAATVGTSTVLLLSWCVLLYAVAMAGIQTVVLVVAAARIPRALARETRSSLDDIFAHPATPGVSAIVPARNERAGIVDAVRSLMALRYPALEIVVVDDGSDDGTAEVLIEMFGLVPSQRGALRDVPVRGEILSVFAQPHGPLVLVRKRGVGRKADALNAGVRYATHPLLCMVDGDSVLEPDALLRATLPLIEDPDVAAVGGVVRPANGLVIERGEVAQATAPRSWLARIQVVEYLRAFLMARVAFTGANGVLIVAGAFGVFRTDLVAELGGLDVTSVAEDAELVATLHHRLRAQGRPCRVVIVPRPVCWSEVPENHRDLGQQRRRWAAGLASVLIRHRGAMLRPRFGTFGLLILPYFLVFELLAPFVEVMGWVVVPLGWILGVTDLPFTVAYVLASLGFGVMVSTGALIADEIAFHRYARVADVLALLAAAVLENLGVRQLICVHRIRGTVGELLRREISWGHHRRTGFAVREGGGPRPVRASRPPRPRTAGHDAAAGAPGGAERHGPRGQTSRTPSSRSRASTSGSSNHLPPSAR